jgi:hypothetical protein
LPKAALHDVFGGAAKDTEFPSVSTPNRKSGPRRAFAGAMMKSWFGMPTHDMPNDSVNTSAAREQGTRFGRLLSMLFVVVAISLLAIAVGYYIVALISSNAPPGWAKYLQIGAAGISLSLLLPAVNQIILTFEKLLRYVKDGSNRDELFPEFVRAGTTVMALAIAVISFTMSTPEKTEQGAAKEVTQMADVAMSATAPAKDLVYLVRAPDSGPNPAAYFSYLFDLAVGPSNWATGTTLNDQQAKDLQLLVATLKACVGKGPDQDVEIDVRGYADTNEFRANTSELNRQAANRRAAHVHDRLRTIIGEQKGPSRLVLHKLLEWPQDDPQAMTRARYFATKPLRETGAERDQGLLNRRADVVVLRLGACERLVAK